MNIINKALKFYRSHKRKIDPHLAFLGAYLTTKFVIRRAKAIISSLSRSQVDIVKRYGKGTYALITGGAAGIGKEFALDLARKGFNLILVDFNKANLEATQAEILKMKNDLIVKTILLDFSKGDVPEFSKQFQQEISQLDISILINNVGTLTGGFGIFHKLPHQNVINCFNINYISSIIVTHSVINQMLLRDKYQSLILNLSSASSLFPVPYLTVYGATKVAIASFFDALSLELQNNKNIDILTLKPLYVRTQMTRYENGYFVIEPNELVQEAWKYPGKCTEVTPHWKHQFQKYLFTSLPAFIRNTFNEISRRKRAEALAIRQNLEVQL